MKIGRESLPAHVRHSSSTKRAQLLLAVSEQAPAHFHSPYLPAIPGALERKPKAKFHYEDLWQLGEDLSSVRPKLYFDTLKGQESRRKYRQPYYRAYRRCRDFSTFGICEGMCSEMLRNGQVRKTEQPVKRLRRRKKSSGNSSVNPFEASVPFSSADTYGRVPGVTSFRLRRSGALAPSKSPYSSREDSLQSSRELDDFDLRLKSPAKR